MSQNTPTNLPLIDFPLFSDSSVPSSDHDGFIEPGQNHLFDDQHTQSTHGRVHHAVASVTHVSSISVKLQDKGGSKFCGKLKVERNFDK